MKSRLCYQPRYYPDGRVVRFWYLSQFDSNFDSWRQASLQLTQEEALAFRELFNSDKGE